MSHETKNCPFCHNEVMAWVKRCPHCDKWLVPEGEQKDEFSERPKVTKSNIPWFRILLGLVYAGLMCVGVMYEINAQSVLSCAQQMEKAKKYETAIKGYQFVIEKSYLSFASISAKEGFRKVRTKFGVASAKRLETTLLENRIDDFSPYLHHGLPFVVCPAYAFILLSMFIVGLCHLKFELFRLVWAGVFGGLFACQLIEYKMVDGLFSPEFAHMIMSNPRILFIGCYLLIIIGMVRSLIPKKKEVNKKPNKNAI